MKIICIKKKREKNLKKKQSLVYQKIMGKFLNIVGKIAQGGKNAQKISILTKMRENKQKFRIRKKNALKIGEVEKSF